MRLNIRTKLLIGFMTLLSISFFVLVFMFVIIRQYISAQVHNTLLEKARNASTYTRNFILTLEEYNSQIASAVRDDVNNSYADSAIVTKSIIREQRFIDNITLYNTQGDELMRTFSPYREPLYDSFSSLTQEQLELSLSGTVSYSSIYYEQDSPHMRVFYPILSRSREVLGAIELQVNLQGAWSVLSQIRLGEAGLSYVVDNNGRVIAHPDGTFARNGASVRNRPILTHLLQSTQTDSSLVDPVITYYTNENGIKVVAQAVKLIETNWIVVFEQPVDEAFEFVNFTRNITIGTGLTTVLLLFIIAYVLSNSFTQPIIVLEKYARSLEKGKFDEPLKLGSHDEIESLGNAFNSMADQIKEREKNLIDGKRQMETMIQSLSDGVIAVDSQYRIILCNASAERLLGIKTKEVVGRSAEGIVRVYRNDELLVMENYSSNPELLMTDSIFIKRPDDNRIPVFLRVSPVITQNGQESHQTGWIIAFTDRRKELEIEEMKLDFVITAAHELRTPLTAIRGYVDVLAMEQEHMSDQGKIYLNRMAISSRSLAVIIDNLLSASRIERGMFKIDPHPTDIVNIAEEAYNNLLPEAQEHKQKFEFVRPEGEIQQVLVDPIKIREVFSNFISNALRYTPDEGSISIRISQENNMVTVAVQDTGSGIPEGAAQKLFTKFFSVSRGIEESAKGPGLGLFISKAIIDLHKGKIWAESQEGKGSTFYFSVPVSA